MRQNLDFSKLQKVIVWMLMAGAFFMGIAMSRWVLRGLDLDYDRQAPVVFGFFGAFTLGATILVRILVGTDPDDPKK